MPPFLPRDGGVEGGSVGAKVAGGVHLVLEGGELAALLDLGPGLLEPRHGEHVEPRDDAHHRVEVADVDALTRDLDPELDNLHPVLLLLILQEANLKFGITVWHYGEFPAINK